MQLYVHHYLDEPLVLPINYSHIMQSIIFNSINYNQYSNFLHSEGYKFGKKIYKMFQFSHLSGHYSVKDHRITFDNEIEFEVRSVAPDFIKALKEGFDNNGITYINRHFDKLETHIDDKTIEGEQIIIKMSTPVTVYVTDDKTGKTIFYPPDMDEFAELIQNNFIRKYAAYTGVVPDEDIYIRMLDVTQKDKFVTKYKGFYVSGWYGEYLLEGQRKYLDFLYQTGIGSRNSQGFGMFDVLEMM